MPSRTLPTSLLALFASVVAAGQAPVVEENPLGVTYSALLPDSANTPIRGAIKGASAPDGVGTNFLVSVNQLPESGAPYSYYLAVNNVPVNGDCSTAGAMLNSNAGATDSTCTQNNKAQCAVGNLSGKWGKMEQTVYAGNYVDKYLSMKPAGEAFFGNGSVVITDSTGAVVTCAGFIAQGMLARTLESIPNPAPAAVNTSTMTEPCDEDSSISPSVPTSLPSSTVSSAVRAAGGAIASSAQSELHPTGESVGTAVSPATAPAAEATQTVVSTQTQMQTTTEIENAVSILRAALADNCEEDECATTTTLYQAVETAAHLSTPCTTVTETVSGGTNGAALAAPLSNTELISSPTGSSRSNGTYTSTATDSSMSPLVSLTSSPASSTTTPPSTVLHVFTTTIPARTMESTSLGLVPTLVSSVSTIVTEQRVVVTKTVLTTRVSSTEISTTGVIRMTSPGATVTVTQTQGWWDSFTSHYVGAIESVFNGDDDNDSTTSRGPAIAMAITTTDSQGSTYTMTVGTTSGPWLSTTTTETQHRWNAFTSNLFDNNDASTSTDILGAVTGATGTATQASDGSSATETSDSSSTSTQDGGAAGKGIAVTGFSAMLMGLAAAFL